MHAWILALMLVLAPRGPVDTYESTARAIDDEAHRAPLYEGDDGPARTAADVVALAWAESQFEPRAVARDGSGALCLGQIDPSNLRRLRVTREQLLDDPHACVRAMLALMRESHRTCRSRATDERLAQYTGGGGACDRGLAAARFRTRLARWLLRRHRVRWVEISAPGDPRASLRSAARRLACPD